MESDKTPSERFDEDAARGAQPALSPAAERAARSAIRDCLYRYARGIDRHDPELTLSAYHDDALDDHGFFIGSARDFAYRAVRTHANFASHQHYMMNHLVEFDATGMVASAETYYLMAARRRSDHGVELGGGRYVDRFELRDGRWAIAERLCIVEWSRDPSVFAALQGAYLSGRQDRQDPSYWRPVTGGRAPRNDIPAFLTTPGEGA